MKPHVDYSLYLVTDSTPAILGSRDLCEVVEQAIQGGVTLVQYRDKTSDTGALISTARKLHEICRAHGVPLLINDRVDVALAVGCEGVHVGQDDMDVPTARRLLGPNAIIGVTVSSIEETRIAVSHGADYLGIGTLYSTATKKNTKTILGINGIRSILFFLSTHPDKAFQEIDTVVIGGINANNVQRVHYQLYTRMRQNPFPKRIDGVAVVSAIMGASNPKEAAVNFTKLISSYPPFVRRLTYKPLSNWDRVSDTQRIDFLLQQIPAIAAAVHAKTPLSHNMTNLVVQHFAASVALAIGASPIMSNNGAEAADLARLGGGLVINMGTATPETLRNQCLAVEAYNSAGNPVVLDPVGAGATSARKEALRTLMAAGYFSVIKGNESEILEVARASGLDIPSSSSASSSRNPEDSNRDADEPQQRGVDSGPSSLSSSAAASLVTSVAARERNIVLLTGSIDYLSDGTRTVRIRNGHALLGAITGSGCTLGTTISAYLAAYPQDAFAAALAAVLHFEIAAEIAAQGKDVEGPGTFVPAFVDALKMYGEDLRNGMRFGWKVEVADEV